MSQLTTIQLASDLKRMSRMTCSGSRARIIEVLCDAIETELKRRAVVAMEEIE